MGCKGRDKIFTIYELRFTNASFAFFILHFELDPGSSHIKPYMQDIAITHHIVFTFNH